MVKQIPTVFADLTSAAQGKIALLPINLQQPPKVLPLMSLILARSAQPAKTRNVPDAIHHLLSKLLTRQKKFAASFLTAPTLKFNPCMNRSCPYKHTEGQKASFPDKVWVAGQEKPHVSERKFVEEEGGEEELIKPDAAQAEQVIT